MTDDTVKHVFNYAPLLDGFIMFVRYLFYILIIRVCNEIFRDGWNAINSAKRKVSKLLKKNTAYLIFCVVCVMILKFLKQNLFDETFIYVVLAYVVITQIDSYTRKPVITYGVGLACSYTEGYLKEVIPNDGSNLIGFLNNTKKFESSEKICFPVKKLFVVINKSFHCPADLMETNKEGNENLCKMYPCKSLPAVERDVAGVKNRKYSNSVYQIQRPGKKQPVYLCVEYATPIHTLYKVLRKRSQYQRLSNADALEIVDDFVEQLREVARWPEYKDKFELVFYDSENENDNLADILLETIKGLAPNFEEIIQTTNARHGVQSYYEQL